MLNIAVIGSGYVGLVTGACFADLGNEVTCIDVDAAKIAQLKKGLIPIYEPKLDAIVTTNIKENRLHFATALAELPTHPQVIFIAVGTPSDKEGAADIKYVLDAAKSVGNYITEHCVIVDKSTVPVGMADQVHHVVRQALNARGITLSFDVVSNPEFLREGAAIQDFMHPDRVIVGLESHHAKNTMAELYAPIARPTDRLYFMNIKDAEMTKYAANAMLASRISFMNEMAVLCERMGADIANIKKGIGTDSRIGSAFLEAGCGYGGSCFPKDVRALIKMAEQHGVEPVMLHAIEKRNILQKQVLSQRIQAIFGDDLGGIVIAVWGLSFKPGTDDMREAPSLVFIEQIIHRGGTIQAYDPAAMEAAKRVFPAEWFHANKLILADNQYAALNKVDAMALLTEWEPFCYPDTTAMKKLMRRHIVLDGRNQYDPQALRDAGFEYYGVGR